MKSLNDMAEKSILEKAFSMSDEVWARHANPWSVWTRYSCLPLLAIAVWSREWIGVYSLVPIALVCLWTWLNPRFFRKPITTNHWASKAVLGERVWLHHPKEEIPAHHLRAIRLLNVIAFAGFLLAIWGLIDLAIWPTVFGTIITMLGKSWFLDRMVWLFQDLKNEREQYQSWDY